MAECGVSRGRGSRRCCRYSGAPSPQKKKFFKSFILPLPTAIARGKWGMGLCHFNILKYKIWIQLIRLFTLIFLYYLHLLLFQYLLCIVCVSHNESILLVSILIWILATSGNEHRYDTLCSHECCIGGWLAG